MATFYSILSVSQEAPLEDIRKNYREKCLNCHPDKTADPTSDFQLIQRAWETLRDPVLRANYDKNLLGATYNRERSVSFEVDLDDMKEEVEAEIWTYPCRCGSRFMISSDCLEQDINVIQCEGCSLYVRVLFTEYTVSEPLRQGDTIHPGIERKKPKKITEANSLRTFFESHKKNFQTERIQKMKGTQNRSWRKEGLDRHF